MNLSAQSQYNALLFSAYQCLLTLATEDGINASGKDEIYGCIFGRDSAITILKIIRFLAKNPSIDGIEKKDLSDICRRALLRLIELQGKTFTLESGEEPGKFIHEYRKDKFEHLVDRQNPWFVYPDGELKNYDSIDATPLGLIAIYRYFELTHDADFMLRALPAVEKGLNWIISYGDIDCDFLIEYEFKKERKFGGLRVQSWTDSHESMKQVNGRLPKYPIAPVEAQGYAWLALKAWAQFYRNTDQSMSSQTKQFADRLESRSISLKKRFNEVFLLKDSGLSFAAQALDGGKNQVKTITGNPLLLLWASHKEGSSYECVLESLYIDQFVKRAFLPDLFDLDAGIRTMSAQATAFDSTQNSYHNGSFWPKLNGMIHEGLLHWNFKQEADQLRTASLKPIVHFGTPIELYIKTESGYLEWKNSRSGQTSCRNQAWSAASILDLAL